ncbi:MAG: NAD(P)H-hydrate dehydratase [Clostridia bacterium]|nr:NAD(P)H-hydrate dehydratase [Clostridia bacterium]
MNQPIITTKEYVAGHILPRTADSHKGTYGTLLTLCGSYGMAGAALLCARGALRSGVGLLRAAVPQSVYPLLVEAIPEAVFHAVAERDGCFSAAAIPAIDEALATADAVVVGCGMGRGEEQTALVRHILTHSTVPVILDADGINAISPHILAEETRSAPLILTPHPGEMARLLDVSTAEVQANRQMVACRLAREVGAVVVLKGHRTLIASPDGEAAENPTGNPGMATGGSGDVLAGIIGSLAAQGLAPYAAAVCGVYLHGAAGDVAAARHSEHGMLPTDLIEELGSLFLQFEK